MGSFMKTSRFLSSFRDVNVFGGVRALSTISNYFNDVASSDSFEYFPVNPVYDLWSIFSKKPVQRNREEMLCLLGRTLTTETVESVLRELKCGWNCAYEFFLWAEKQEGFRHNRYTFNAMASILSRANLKSPLMVLVKNMVGSRCSMTAGSLGFLIRCLGSVGLADEANYVFDNAGMMHCVPSSYTYTCLLEALTKCRRYDSLEVRLKEMNDSGLGADKFTLTAVLQAYCNSGRLTEAMGILDKMCANGWADEHAFTILILGFSKSGAVDKAFELIERMERMNLNLNKKTYHVLIHGFKQENRIDKALVLFDKMKEDGIGRDVGLYSVIIEDLCKNKEYFKAFNLYMEMRDSGVFPDKAIIGNLVAASCTEGKMEILEKLLEEAKILNIGSSIFIYNAVLEGLVACGEVEKARSLLQVMVASATGEPTEHILKTLSMVSLKLKAELPNVSSFSIVLGGLCKSSSLDSALELLKDMRRIGCKGNQLIYNNLIHELCNFDRFEEAQLVLKNMKDSGFEPNHFTYNSIFGCLCRRENVDSAIDLIKEMQTEGCEPWIKHCTLLVKKLCVRGKVIEACNFLDSMVQAGVQPDMIVYSTVIHGLCKKGELDNAVKLFYDMSKNGCIPDMVCHNILMHGFCKAGRIPEAENLLNEVLEKGLVPSVVSYNSIIDAWCKNERVDLAFFWFSKMNSKARLPNVITYTTLVHGLCNSGRVEDALMLWNEMENKGCSPNKIAYTALIRGLCKCNRVHTALQFYRDMQIKGLDPDSFLFVELINDPYPSHYERHGTRRQPSRENLSIKLMTKGNCFSPLTDGLDDTGQPNTP
ncbi:putative pentatricopeptide repeat-containing protein [Nymphaea thermarum]|nr:putative pentatricopeptide repeat-containing protein [Nymphaea thermarum]